MTKDLSLRARLLLAVGAITLLALVVADFAVYTSLRSYLYGQQDHQLEASHRQIEAAANFPNQGKLAIPPPPEGTPGQSPGESTFCGVGLESAPGMFIEVLNRSGQVVTSSAGREQCRSFQPGSQSFTPKIPAVVTGFSTSVNQPGEPTVYFTVPSTTSNGPAFQVRASKLVNGGILILAAPVGGISSTLSQLVLVELLVTGAALIGAVLLGLWLVRVGLRPLRDVQRTAESIAAGDLMHRVPNANARTEVGHVATALNFMLEQIQAAFAELRISERRLRQFVGDASHELRTPIAAVSAYAQLFKQGASTRQEDLVRVMSGIERESARMTRLVEDLLTLTKLDERHVLDLQPVELVGLVAEAVETARAVGPGWPISFVADNPVEVMGDFSALRQVLDNLLSNVRSHTPEGTLATLTVWRDGQFAYAEVADEGLGIAEGQAELIFERFFRADPSRSRETGGSGLGLAIVASIVAAHGGRVEAISRAGRGAVFKVCLPLLAPTSTDIDR